MHKLITDKRSNEMEPATKPSHLDEELPKPTANGQKPTTDNQIIITNNQMFRHSLLLIYRNFKRFKTTFFINLTGLSTGLACTLLIYLWVNDELKVDKFHEKDSQLYRVMEHRLTDGGIRTALSAPGLLGESMAAEFPEVEYAINSSSMDDYTLTVHEKNMMATGRFAGNDFFRMFSYDLVYGDTRQVLLDKNSIVISDDLASKLFGTVESAVGKSVALDHDELFHVTGIFKKVPASSSEQFDFVGSFEKYKESIRHEICEERRPQRP